jgi:hypothetical protein
MIRILLIAFNVAAVAILIYRLIQVSQTQMEPSRKRIIVIVGIILLLLPVTMLLRFIPPTMLYFFIYPIGISLFIYLTWDNRAVD